jgi:hypothetical protein
MFRVFGILLKNLSFLFRMNIYHCIIPALQNLIIYIGGSLRKRIQTDSNDSKYGKININA